MGIVWEVVEFGYGIGREIHGSDLNSVGGFGLTAVMTTGSGGIGIRWVHGDRGSCDIRNLNGRKFVKVLGLGECVFSVELKEEGGDQHASGITKLVRVVDGHISVGTREETSRVLEVAPDVVLEIKVGKVLFTLDWRMHGGYSWTELSWLPPKLIAGDNAACEVSNTGGPHVTGIATGTCFVRITASETMSREPFGFGESEYRIFQINVSPQPTITQPPTTTLDIEELGGETSGPGPGDCVEAFTFEESPKPSDQSALFDYTFILEEPGDAIRLTLLPCDSLQYIASTPGGAKFEFVVGAISGSPAASELELAWINWAGQQESKGRFDDYGLAAQHTSVGHPFVIRYKIPQPEVNLADDCESYEARQPFTFRQETIKGWRIHFECIIEYTPGLMPTIVNDLTADLAYINSILPAPILTRLQATDVFIVGSTEAKPNSKMKTGCGGAVFMNPLGDMASQTVPEAYSGSVVVNAHCWIGTREEQPAGLTLHEFAHAWHCMNWPCFEGDTQISEAYEAAVASGSYDLVERGERMERHYGLTDKQEYFAELTEAWFWKNETYPYNREDLLNHDPLGAAVVEAAWSVVP
jgi:hypothetical protein